MLVFSQFTSFLDVLAAELDARDVPYLVLTGSTPKRRRVELVDRFNGDATPVFLISLKAGGTGLNLTGASVVVHADPWWNEAAQNQATDRAHRIGQTRDVTVYRVIAQDSIEERILDLQRTKAQLADAVVEGDATGMSLASLTREDLEDLLG
jgi:SNF2 family DNA or RNA helicase